MSFSIKESFKKAGMISPLNSQHTELNSGSIWEEQFEVHILRSIYTRFLVTRLLDVPAVFSLELSSISGLSPGRSKINVYFESLS